MYTADDMKSTVQISFFSKLSLHGRAVLTKRCIWSLVFNLSSTEEDSLELLEVKHTITSSVVLSNHIVNFLTIDLLAELLHGEANIFLSDLT